MKKEWRDKWCAALRSDRYKQTRQRMHYRTRIGGWEHCANGVLAVLYGMKPRTRRPSLAYDDEILKGTGLEEDQVGDIEDLNDEGRSFPEIADWIEANIPAE